MDADRSLFDLYREMTVQEKTDRLVQLLRLDEALATAGIRMRHPDATPREIRLRLAALRYGADLVRRAFGWDPEREGW